jgi:RimJ/RimL family protein N-acetyltransferase
MPFKDFDSGRPEVSTLVASRAALEVHLMTWQDLPPFDELRERNREWLSEWVVDNAVKKNTNAVSFAVKLNDEPVGEVVIWNVARETSMVNPSMSYWVDERHARCGIMKFAVRAVLDHARESMKLSTVLVPIANDNVASLALAKSLGLTRLGSVDYDGAHARHTMFAEDWSRDANL